MTTSNDTKATYNDPKRACVDTAESPQTTAVDRARTIPSFSPPADVYETAAEVFIVVDLPGADEASIEVTVKDDILAIHGATRRPDASGDYDRSFRLGDDLDQAGIDATLADGVLTLRLQKRKATSQRVEIRPS